MNLEPNTTATSGTGHERSVNPPAGDPPADDKTKQATGEPQDPPADKTGDDPGGNEPDTYDRAYVENLRKESAKYRTRAKENETKYNALEARFSKLESGLKTLFGEGEEEVPPEEQVQRLQVHNQALEMDREILALAVEHSIPKDGIKYFKFLLNERLEALQEGEELDEEQLLEVVKDAKAKTGVAASTSVGSKPGQQPNPEGGGQITVEQFAKMSMTEKSKLFGQHPELYKQLLAQAKEKKLLV